MVKQSFDLNVPKDGSNTDEAAQNGGTPKSVTFEIHHGGCFTPTPSRSYIGGQVSSVNVVDIDEFCLHDLKDMLVKLCYGVADLMYFYFLIPRLGLDYGLHPLNVDADVLEMAKYVKDYKIILVYVEHGSSNIDTSIFVTFKKGFAIAVDNHLRKGPIEIDSSPDVNRNLTPMFVVESADPFEDLDKILEDYANTRDEITRKQMVVHVGNSSTVDDVLDLQMLFETKRLVILGSSKKWRWKQIMNQKKRLTQKKKYTSGSDLEDFDYDPKHDEMVDDDEHIVKDVHVSMNNFNFNADPRHDLSIGAVEKGWELDGKAQFQPWSLMLPVILIWAKIYFSQTKGGPVIRENNINDKKNILSKDKIVQGKGKNVNKQNKEDKYSCPWTMLVAYSNEDRWEKQFDVVVSKMKAFRAKRIVTDKITGTFKEQYSQLREYAQELINQNPSKNVRYDVQQEPNPESLTRTFRRVYVCLEALKQGFRACCREILGLDGCFMSDPWPGQILTSVGLLGEDLGIEANFNYTFISDRQKGLLLAIAYVFPSVEHRYHVRHIHENMKSQYKGGVYKEMLWNVAKATYVSAFNQKMAELKSFNPAAYDWLMKTLAEQWTRSYFSSRAKCDLLLNNINEVFNRQLVDGKDQPIITCLEYIIEYLMKRIVVVQKLIVKTVGPHTPSVTVCVVNLDTMVCSCRKWELTGIPCKHDVAAIYNMYENLMGVGVPEHWVHAAYIIEAWAHKRKKSYDEIASQSASSGKLSRKGKSVSYGKCGNMGHNRKGCRGQGGSSSQAGARKVSSQAAGATNVSGQAVGARKVSSQAAGATNVSGQAAGARKVTGQAADARKASSQPNEAQSTSKQGPRQGFQGPIACPASGSQRKTKKLMDL
ncbi:mutator type transposase [Tanacetum coccineum]